MQKARLKEIIDNVLAWGLDQDAEFRERLIHAMDLDEEEIEELELKYYVSDEAMDDDIYNILFYAGYHEWCLILNEIDVYSFGDLDLAEEMYDENLPFDVTLNYLIDNLIDSMVDNAKDDDASLSRKQRKLILALESEHIEKIKEQMRTKLTNHYKFD